MSNHENLCIVEKPWVIVEAFVVELMCFNHCVVVFEHVSDVLISDEPSPEMYFLRPQ